MTNASLPSILTLRTCIGCHIINKKEDMLRLSLNPNQEAIVNGKGGAGGRGAYVCNLSCLKRALEKNQLSRAFRQKVNLNRLMKLVS
ncbi:YlxR family protein [Patescibacteria group bacterium]|nr:YlxR family protein [Patescibacteria group bacterium]